jgi:hypothetical protein
MRGLVVLLALFTGADVLGKEGEVGKRVDNPHRKSFGVGGVPEESAPRSCEDRA